MAEDSRKMRLVGSFDEYGYRPGLAGSLAQGLFKAAQPTRYPKSVGERLIGGVFDGLATHRNMRIQDDLAIAEREKREIEMEELRRNQNISRQLDELRTNAMTGDFLGRTLGTADYMQQLAQITGDPTAMAEAMKFKRLGIEALDNSMQQFLLEKGFDPQKIAEINRTGDFSRYPEIAEQIKRVRVRQEEKEDAEMAIKQADLDTKQEQLLQSQYNSYEKAADDFFKLSNYSQNLVDKSGFLLDDLNALLDGNTEVGKALADAASKDVVEKAQNIILPNKRTLLEATLGSIQSRIAFDQLLKIKQEGGTLGALSNEEFKALANNIAALDADLSPKQLLAQLKQIRDRLKRGRDTALLYSNKRRSSLAKTATRFGSKLNASDSGFSLDLSPFNEVDIVPPIEGKIVN